MTITLHDRSSNASTQSTVFIDARCFQRQAYRTRGIGHHSMVLLRSLRSTHVGKQPLRVIGFIDGVGDPLLPQHVELFDKVEFGPPTRMNDEDIFISLSPMTEDCIWLDDVLSSPSGLKVAISYDFIPLAFANTYLTSMSVRRQYLERLKALADFDRVAAISQHTKDELSKIAPVSPSKIFVTGVAVRSEIVDASRLGGQGERSIAVAVSGDEWRKNLTTVLRAHARSATFAAMPLYVVGGRQSRDLDVAAEEKAASAHMPEVVFCPHLSDTDFAALLERAVVAIIPSRAEGFSIPVVEASALGCVVIVSDIPCHRELIADDDVVFPPDDVSALIERVEKLVTDDAFAKRARMAQSGVWRRFTQDAVGARFREGIAARPLQASPAVIRPPSKKPKLAFVTPLPPAKSGVADYSQATLRALSKYADIHVFSETKDPHFDASWQSVSPVGTLKYVRKEFDRIVCVLGNSSHHLEAFKYLMTYGGAAILHDARMLNFYHFLVGREHTIALDKKERGSDRETDIERLLHHQHELQTLFLSEILSRAEPAIVHSKSLQAKISSIYNKEVFVLPFALYREPASPPQGRNSRVEAKHRLAIDPGTLLVCTFGGVVSDKAPEIIIWTARLLQAWGLRFSLVFCGSCDLPVKTHLIGFAEQIGLTSDMTIFEEATPRSTYADYLSAADCAVQLRTHALGSVSGGLNDCIEYAIPCVANASLAEAMDVPEFVKIVPDALSPLLIAEAVSSIFEGTPDGDRLQEQARAFAAQHSPDLYARRLLEVLDLEISGA